MAERYDIDFVRAILQHELNDSSILLTSFYEQIGDADALARYAQEIKDLIYDQNKQSYKARGVVAQNGDADIVNITSNYICPLEYSVRLDVAYYKQLEEDSVEDLSDVEYVNEAIIDLIDNIKGRKFDVAMGEEGDLYVFKTPYVNANATKYIHLDNDIYMVNSGARTIAAHDDEVAIADQLFGTGGLYCLPYVVPVGATAYNVYIYEAGKLYSATITYTDGSPDTFVLSTPVLLEDSITKYKVSLSINNVQRDMPYDFNGTGRMAIFFNGQATIVDENVMLGNDIVKTTIQVGSGTAYEVEPIENPSVVKFGDTNDYYTAANSPKATSHNFSTNNTINYSFHLSSDNALLVSLYNICRSQTFASPITTENAIFSIVEYNYKYSVLTKTTIKAKLDSINVSNTNGDVLTIGVSFKMGAY